LSHTNQPYDASDPRLAKVISKYDKRYGPEPTKPTGGVSAKDYLSVKLRTYGAPDRSLESEMNAYHEAIEAFANDQVKDSQIVLQEGNDFYPIKRSQVKPNLDLEPSCWVHFTKVEVAAKSRLYIPCSLKANAGRTICGFLWEHPQVLRFKIVGYGDAVDRADVVVAWFGHVDHARPAGVKVEQVYASLLSGQRPIGAFTCTNAGQCGWAPEIGTSVGANIREDLLQRWPQTKPATG